MNQDASDTRLIYASYPSLQGRSVFITGGASGIGESLVRHFCAQGSRVAFIDIAEESGRELTAAISAEGRAAPLFIPCDLRDIEALKRAIGQAVEQNGPLQVLCNNAGNDDRHQTEDVTVAYWDDRMAVNLRHQFFCAQAVTPGMREQGRGVILNFGSISWHLALPCLTLYMTAKAAIEGLTRGLARDLGPHGIRVNCIIPGAVRTPRQMRLWHSPEEEAKILAAQCLYERVEPHDVAALALFLASDSAAKCSGRDYFVDAGWYGA